jgi:hypothetical protein
MSWDPDPRQPRPSPHGEPSSPHPTAKRNGVPTWVWVLLGGGGLSAVLCCGVGTFGMMALGANVMEVEVRDQLRDNPKLREHIGEIQSFETDVFGSLAEPGSDSFRYTVRGTLGEGELKVRHVTGEDAKEVVEEANLRLSNGTQVQLVP